MKRIAYSLFLAALLSSCGPSHPLNYARIEFNHSESDNYCLPTEWVGSGPGRFMWGFTSGLNIATRFESPVSTGFSSYTEKRIIGALGGIEIGYFQWPGFSYTAQILFDQKGFERNGFKSVFNYVRYRLHLTIQSSLQEIEWCMFLQVQHSGAPLMVSSITEYLPESVTSMAMESLIIFCKSDMHLD